PDHPLHARDPRPVAGGNPQRRKLPDRAGPHRGDGAVLHLDDRQPRLPPAVLDVTMARMQLQDVGVAYPVYNAASQSLRKQIVSISTGGRVSAAKGHVATVQALEDINLDLKDGDR